jgi:hypothetical protein
LTYIYEVAPSNLADITHRPLQVLIAKLRPSAGVGSRGIDVERASLLALDLLLEDLSSSAGGAGVAAQPLFAVGGMPGAEALAAGELGDEASRRHRDRVELARRMRRPKLELLTRVAATYGDRLAEDKALRALDVVERCLEQLSAEGAVGGGSETLQLELRQSLLTSALLLVRCEAVARKARGMDEPPPYMAPILAHAVASLAALEAVQVEDMGASALQACASERVETVLQTCLMTMAALVEQSTVGTGPDEEAVSVRERTEEMVVGALRQSRVLEAVLAHWAAASQVAAAAFPVLHDYTAAGSAREGAVAMAEKPLRLSMARLETILTFLSACSAVSRRFGAYLLQANAVAVLVEDPVVQWLARVVEPRTGTPAALLYQRGYRADGEESPYYALWAGLVQLVGTLLHTLTPPSLGYEAVLAAAGPELDPTLAYYRPQTPEEAAAVQQVGGFLRRLAPLLLWPLGDANRTLTLQLLGEAGAVMTLVRELAVHGYMAEAGRAEPVKRFVKPLVVRCARIMAQALAEEGGAVLVVLGDAFAAVSAREEKLLKLWSERRAAARPDEPPLPPGKDIEQMVEDGLVKVLAAAVGFLRYTGPSRLPTRIPLTPAEARQISLAEGTKVWFRDAGGGWSGAPFVMSIARCC